MVVHSCATRVLVRAFPTSLRSHASSLGSGLKFLLLESYARSDMGTSVETSDSLWPSHLQCSLSQDRVRCQKLLQSYYLCGSLVLEAPYSLLTLRHILQY